MQNELPERLRPNVLRQLIQYDPVTGDMLWKPRTVEFFGGRQRIHNAWTAMRMGKPAFISLGKDGYLRGEIRANGRRYSMLKHVVAFAIYHGRYSELQIDHINRDRSDCRISNLRETTPAQNNWNSIQPPGRYLRGTYPSGKRWAAQINMNGKLIYLGTFSTEIEAHIAYKSAQKQFHGEFAPRQLGETT